MKISELNESVSSPIEDWIEHYIAHFSNYPEITNGKIEVDGNVDFNSAISAANSKMHDISVNPIRTLPFKFGKVTGWFDVLGAGLTNLKNFPDEIGDYCDITQNHLRTLEGAPEKVGPFYARSCQLTSLKGAPKSTKSFDVGNNKLTSLEFGPSYVDGDFDCQNNDITSFHDIHKHLKHVTGTFWCDIPKIKSSVLGFLKIEELYTISNGTGVNDDEWVAIINKYLEKIRKNPGIDINNLIIDCQEEMLDAGLEEYAKL